MLNESDFGEDGFLLDSADDRVHAEMVDEAIRAIENLKKECEEHREYSISGEQILGYFQPILFVLREQEKKRSELTSRLGDLENECSLLRSRLREALERNKS